MFFNSVWNKPSAFQPLQFRQKSRLFPKTRRRFYRHWRTTTPSPSVPRCVGDEWWWFSHFLAFRLAPQSRPPPPLQLTRFCVTSHRSGITISLRPSVRQVSPEAFNQKIAKTAEPMPSDWDDQAITTTVGPVSGGAWATRCTSAFPLPTQNANTMATEWWRANINQALLTYIYLLFCYCWCWWWGAFLICSQILGLDIAKCCTGRWTWKKTR